MCDDSTEKDNKAFELRGGSLNRRDFSKLSVAAIASLCYGKLANASGVFEGKLTESDVNVPMKNGSSDCFFVHPKEGKHPGILMWPDLAFVRFV